MLLFHYCKSDFVPCTYLTIIIIWSLRVLRIYFVIKTNKHLEEQHPSKLPKYYRYFMDSACQWCLKIYDITLTKMYVVNGRQQERQSIEKKGGSLETTSSRVLVPCCRTNYTMEYIKVMNFLFSLLNILFHIINN